MTLSLDGTSPTGAWSMYRDLLTSFVGGTRYTTATGVNSLNDQTGNARHFTSSGGSAQPVVTAAGPNSKTCADFDGSNDYMETIGMGLGNFITASTGYIVISFIVDGITTNDATLLNNRVLFGDAGSNMGLLLKNTGSPATILAYNWDGTEDSVPLAAITVGSLHVAEWRHQGGNVYLRVNSGSEVSVASGNTSTGNPLRLARLNNVSLNGNVKIFEAATFQTIPALATRNAIVANWLAQADAAAGRAKVWTGSAWALKPVKVWSGSAWVTKPLKVWNGSAWV